jgi:PHD/YefM family antitoxin component YafN of YafNO toxin-antitoxin module
MSAVTATEFARNFGRYREEAQRAPVAITSHGRISGYFVSEHEFKELQRLRALERRVYRIRNLPAGISEAIRGAKMDPAHKHLDSLPDEKEIRVARLSSRVANPFRVVRNSPL